MPASSWSPPPALGGGDQPEAQGGGDRLHLRVAGGCWLYNLFALLR